MCPLRRRMTDIHTSHPVAWTRLALSTHICSRRRVHSCPWETCSHHRKHRQTHAQQSTFFSTTPHSQTMVQWLTRSTQTLGLTSLLGFPPQLTLPLQPAPSRSRGIGRLQWRSQGDAPQNSLGFILHLLASPGIPKGGKVSRVRATSLGHNYT